MKYRSIRVILILLVAIIFLSCSRKGGAEIKKPLSKDARPFGSPKKIKTSSLQIHTNA